MTTAVKQLMGLLLVFALSITHVFGQTLDLNQRLPVNSLDDLVRFLNQIENQLPDPDPWLSTEEFLEFYPEAASLNFSRGLTLREYLDFAIKSDFNDDGLTYSQDQIDRLLDAVSRLDGDAYNAVIEEVISSSGITGPARDWLLELYLLDSEEIEALRFLASLLASLTVPISEAGPSAPSVNVITSTMRTTLFTPAKTAQQQAAEERATVRDGIAGLPTRIGTDAFYGRSNLDGGGSIKSYGVNLSAIVGDQLQFRGTIPIHRTDAGFAKITSYGIDGSIKYNVNDNFAVGGHSNYIYHNISGGGNSHNWTVGPFASANFDLNESFNVSFGTMLDYVRPKSGGSEWVVAGGVNLGWSVSPDFVLNPYLIYFRNLDVDFGDKDWWDLGIESSWAIGETWTLSVGAKTTLGYDPFRSNWQIYLGTAWAF